MKKSLTGLLIAFIALTVISCNESEPVVYKEKVTKTNFQQITEKISNDANISAEGIANFINGLTAMIIDTTVTFEDKTVGEIINFQVENSKKRAIAIMNTSAIKLELSINHNFQFLGYQPKDTLEQNFNYMVFAVANIAEKDIKNIEGILQFFNKSNQLIKQYPLKAKIALKDQIIEVGKTVTLKLPFTHDPENQRDMIIRTQLGALRSVWQPTMIEFADGTSIAYETVKK